MSSKTEELAARAALERKRLADAFDSFEHELHELKDWRHHTASQPGLALGAAVAAGMVLGAMTAPRSGHRRSMGDFRPTASGARSSGRSRIPSSALRKAAMLVGEIVIARIMAAAASRARGGGRARRAVQRLDDADDALPNDA